MKSSAFRAVILTGLLGAGLVGSGPALATAAGHGPVPVTGPTGPAPGPCRLLPANRQPGARAHAQARRAGATLIAVVPATTCNTGPEGR